MRTNPFILILIILLGLIIGYFYDSQLAGDTSYEVAIPPTANDPTYVAFKDLRFNLALFDDPSFTSLKILGEFPIQPGNTGKTDLFR